MDGEIRWRLFGHHARTLKEEEQGSGGSESAFGPVVTSSDEQLVVGHEAIDRIDGILVPHPLSGLGGCLAFCTLDHAEELQAAELHKWVHLERRDLVREARVEHPGVL